MPFGGGPCQRNGRARGKQRYRCAECRFNYVEGDARTNDGIAAKRAMLVLLHSLGKASFNMLAHIFDMWPSQVYRWVAGEGLSAPEPEVHGEVREIELDEMWHFVESKKNKLWVIKALDRGTRRTVAWVPGNRDAATFRRPCKKVGRLRRCTFYTDAWRGSRGARRWSRRRGGWSI